MWMRTTLRFRTSAFGTLAAILLAWAQFGISARCDSDTSMGRMPAHSQSHTQLPPCPISLVSGSCIGGASVPEPLISTFAFVIRPYTSPSSHRQFSLKLFTSQAFHPPRA